MPRRHLRYPVSLWVIEKGDGMSFYHHVVDLSLSGMFVEKAVPLAVGEHFPLELPLPTGRSIAAHGIVVRRQQDEATTGNGVVLMGLADGDRDALADFLADEASRLGTA